MAAPPPSHRELLGAVHVNGRSAFRVWAPEARRVEVTFADGGETLALTREDSGYFSGAASGSSRLYTYRVDGDGPWPDPRSRFQPQGVHGPSRIVAPDAHLRDLGVTALEVMPVAECPGGWNSACVALTGSRDSYFHDYSGGAWRIQAQCAVLLTAAQRSTVSNPRPEVTQ